MSKADNLSRWRDSGDPHRWVWKCSGVWSGEEYDAFLATLRTGPFWPMSEDAVARTLAAAKKTYEDLKRWGLLVDQAKGQPPASMDDDEIWF